MNARLSAALDYAGRGWPVFPLWWPIGDRCACGDATCDNIGKHPHKSAPSGVKNATTDVDAVRRWWTNAPDANIGLRTGVAFDVLDLDNVDAGRWLATYAHDRGAVTPDCWGDGPMSLTGKGQHILFTPTGAGNRSRVAGVGGFDWRGRDGYIVAPPSLHASGVTYRWHEHCPVDAPLTDAPVFLVDLVTNKVDPRRTAPPARPARQQLDRPSSFSSTGSARRWSSLSIIGKMATAVEGERNELLHWCAARIGNAVYDGHATESDGAAALDELHTTAVRTGLADKAVEKTIESGYSRGRRGDRPKGVAV